MRARLGINCTLKLRYKGPGRKGIPPIREIFSSPITFFSFHFYMGIREFKSMNKNYAGHLKSLIANFQCKAYPRTEATGASGIL